LIFSYKMILFIKLALLNITRIIFSILIFDDESFNKLCNDFCFLTIKVDTIEYIKLSMLLKPLFALKT